MSNFDLVKYTFPTPTLQFMLPFPSVITCVITCKSNTTLLRWNGNTSQEIHISSHYHASMWLGPPGHGHFDASGVTNDDLC